MPSNVVRLKVKGQGQKQLQKELQAQHPSSTQHLPHTLQAQSRQVHDTASSHTLLAPTIGEVESIVQGQIIHQQQSFEMVQVLLHASFASICYLRNLLPAECFENRDYTLIRADARRLYRTFSEGSVPPQGLVDSLLDEGPDEPSTKLRLRKMHVITRGRSAASDKILSLLDAVSQVLLRNKLAAVQLSVILDRDNPSNVIESYTFSFEYTTDPATAMKHLKGTTFSNPHGEAMAIRSARSGLWLISQQLMELSLQLPDLPDVRFLTIHLLYTDDVPKCYNPPGFSTTKDNIMFVPNDELWKMQEQRLGQMDVGFHSVGLKVNYLPVLLDVDEEGPEDHLVPQIPQLIQCTKSIPRFAPLNPLQTASDVLMSERLHRIARSPSLRDDLVPTQIYGTESVRSSPSVHRMNLRTRIASKRPCAGTRRTPAKRMKGRP